MIDIIKRGTLHEDRYFTITCNRCLSDLKFKGDEEVEATEFYYIVCPVCDQWLDVEKAKELEVK